MKSSDSFSRVAVVGAGSWGTALALVLYAQRYPVVVWGHDPATIAEISSAKENRIYLPGVALPEDLRFTNDLGEVQSADLILLVTPSKAAREVTHRLALVGLDREAVLLSCTKGVERGTGFRMSQILAEAFPENPVAVLSGPSHAEEVARQLPTAIVLGSAVEQIGLRLQRAFSTRSLRAYTSNDVAGIELGGALKNIFALAAGVSDGLRLGDNAKAALVTRSLNELIRLGCGLGGRRETFQGLSGMGDLMVTCFSHHSRNRLVGERLARGETLDAIITSMQMVAEGVPTTYSAFECARRFGIETPIIDQIKAVLDGSVSPPKGLERLLGREPKPEMAGN
jgi:glycerol-3-phosphate dehydrogenase (NAD(P)+)